MAARFGSPHHPAGGARFGSPTWAALGPVLDVTGVTNPIVSGSGSITFTGTNFEASQGSGAAQLRQGAVTVNLTETSWGDTSVVATTPDVFATTLKFGAATAYLKNNTGQEDTQATVINPPANVQVFTLAAVNTTATYRLSASPDLVVGEQVALSTILYSDSGCTTPTAIAVVVDDELDGAFHFASDTPNGTFYMKAWRRRSDTGAWEYAVQTIVIDVVRLGNIAAVDAASDSAAITGTVPVQGSVSATEQSDTAAATGNVRVQGTIAATEQSDTAAATGTVQILGNLDASDAATDSAHVTGTVSGSVETDTTPDPISFPPRTNVAINAIVTFASQIVRGITAPVTITAADGAEYQIGNGPFTSAPGQVSEGEVVTPRVTSPNAYLTQLSPVPSLTIGGINCPLVCVTGPLPTTVAEIMVQRDTGGVTAAVTNDSKLIVTITDMSTFLRTTKRR